MNCALDVETTTAAAPPVNQTEVVPATRSQKALTLVVCFVVFLVVYVLSAGPMVFLHDVFKFSEFQNSLQIIYAPLTAIVKNDIEPFATILKWYIGLFR